MTDYNGNTPNTYIPPLPEGARLFAVNPTTGAWHYVNHAGTWQGMPSPLDEAPCAHEAYHTDSAGQPTRCVDCGAAVTVAAPTDTAGAGGKDDDALLIEHLRLKTGYDLEKVATRAASRLKELLSAAPPVDGLTSGEGWRVVPVEPTEAMWEAFDGYNGDKRTGYDTWRKAWSAMLTASPKATATASVREWDEGAAYCNKCGFHGIPEKHGFHLRPGDRQPCDYAAPVPDSGTAAKRERVWTGPGELERTGYIDPKGDA